MHLACVGDHMREYFWIGSQKMKHIASCTCLEGTAHNMNVVADWFAHVTASLSGQGDQHHDLRANACWGFMHALRIMKRAGMYLNTQQCMELEECRRASL